MKKVLVTGAGGFIGSNMVQYLLKNTDYIIYGIDNFQGGRKNESLIQGLQSDRFIFIDGCFSCIKDLCPNISFDNVYHFAATPRVSYSVKHPLETNENNVSNTLKLLEFCKETGVKRFIFSSSSSVYGDLVVFPTKEDNVKTPKSPYALQKSIIEDYCRLYSSLYGLDTVCLRYFNVYGPGQYAENAYATVICAWIKGFIENSTIRLDGDGSQSRDFTYVDDVCSANYVVGESKETFGGKCFNAAGGNNYSLIDVKKIIETLSENRPNVDQWPSRPGDVLKTHSDSSELEKLGFKAKTNLEEGINITYKWYKNQKT